MQALSKQYKITKLAFDLRYSWKKNHLKNVEILKEIFTQNISQRIKTSNLAFSLDYLTLLRAWKTIKDLKFKQAIVYLGSLLVIGLSNAEPMKENIN